LRLQHYYGPMATIDSAEDEHTFSIMVKLPLRGETE